MSIKFIKNIFLASVVYDGVLAVAFLFFTSPIFEYFGIEKPNHMGYLHFPALLLILFSVMYWKISTNPIQYKILIPYGVGLKISYCTVVLYHWMTGVIPMIWAPLAWIDLVFLVLFIQAWRKVGNLSQAQ